MSSKSKLNQGYSLKMSSKSKLNQGYSLKSFVISQLGINFYRSLSKDYKKEIDDIDKLRRISARRGLSLEDFALE